MPKKEPPTVKEMLCSRGFLSLSVKEQEVIAKMWDFQKGERRMSYDSCARYFGMPEKVVKRLETLAFNRMKRAYVHTSNNK